ncbi:hypothetical protein D0Z08_27065 [Nocardioides immobilis]|uniref:Uncharacterized protein n=1 Tax=Nocardioides immobilis TaxID=2049295 RepID=A0A417XTY2_9ACTN|nr:hypothetical protein D0Z08_27065 [Nocardioides immobilis]
MLVGQVLMPLYLSPGLAYVGQGVARDRMLIGPLALTAVWCLTYWQESLANLTGPRFAYNAALVDRESPRVSWRLDYLEPAPGQDGARA